MIDIHALSGAYAVDALDDLERAEFQRHLAQCSSCRDEVDSLREASALLAETVTVTPPASLRANVLAGITTVRPLPPVVAEVRSLHSHRAARRWLPALAAAAAVVAVIGVGAVVVQPWDDGSSQSSISATDRVLGAPDAQQYTQPVTGGGEATITVSKSLNQAVVTTSGLSVLPSDHVYELWLKDRTLGMKSAGIVKQTNGSQLLEGDAANAVAAGITVERAGGSEIPTTPTVALIPFTQA